MTVKELLEMYDNHNSETKIYGDNMRLIASDTTGLIAASPDIADRAVVKFGFDEDKLCIQVKETVYDMVMQMNKTDFSNFCLAVYRMGLKDGSDFVSDECWVACYLADCTMQQYNEWLKGTPNGFKEQLEKKNYD